VFVVVLVGLSIVWVPLLKGNHGSQIFTYTVQVGSFFQPPIIAVFTLALFTSRVTEKVNDRNYAILHKLLIKNDLTLVFSFPLFFVSYLATVYSNRVRFGV